MLKLPVPPADWYNDPPPKERTVMSEEASTTPLEEMSWEEKLEELFRNGVQLSRLGLNLRSDDVQRYGHVWVEATEIALLSDNFIRAMVTALEGRRDAPELARALYAEVDAVIALQRHALRAVGSSPPSETNRRKEWIRRWIGPGKRAGDATHSISGSFREALGDLLPDWAKGTLKVGEELWEIYGKK
jgi:hypothetical protein